jgi:hypothetical protein
MKSYLIVFKVMSHLNTILVSKRATINSINSIVTVVAVTIAPANISVLHLEFAWLMVALAAVECV